MNIRSTTEYLGLGAFLLLMLCRLSPTYGQKENTVRSYRPLVPVNSFGSIKGQRPSDGKLQVQWQYHDGLGRPIQTIAMGASPQGKDIINFTEYDHHGRSRFRYLPYTSDMESGAFRPDYQNEQRSFYQGTEAVAQDDRPYAVSMYERVPFERIVEQGAEGKQWHPRGASGKTLKFAYGTNFTTDKVDLWTLSEGLPRAEGTYTNRSLVKQSTRDEQDRETIEFLDKQGRLVLRKVQSGASSFALTYYIRDAHNNLRFVLPPLLVQQLISEGHRAPDRALLDRWAYEYRYDHRNRMIYKKLPGSSGPILMVYDDRDRPVLTQDGEQRKKKQWTFTKYDILNRPIATGLYRSEQNTRLALQMEVDRFYEGEAPSSVKWYETRAATAIGYTLRSFPPRNKEADLLTLTYYDDYDFPHAAERPFLPELGHTAYHTPVKSLLTGTRERLLDGSGTWLSTALYYDDRYRLIQTVGEMARKGLYRRSESYSFKGLPTARKESYITEEETLSQQQQYRYDHAQRLRAVEHRVNGANTVTLFENNYNELGQLMEKNLYSEDRGAHFSQSLDYRYTIRGWLKSINTASLRHHPDKNPDTGQEKDLWGMELLYNEEDRGLGNVAQYNGNISGMRWSKGAGGKIEGYTYTYDIMDRLRGADYSTRLPGADWDRSIKSFDVNNLRYDLQGNIKGMTRFNATGGVLDRLVYTYEGHELKKVEDGGAGQQGFIDGAALAEEYRYDANGNMVSDANKGISEIRYNYLNLPQRVEKEGEGHIRYLYGASGAKYAQVVHGPDGEVRTRTDYIGPMIYENGKPALIQHEEGRILMDGDRPEYQYHLKDHLGNVRLTFITTSTARAYSAGMEEERAVEEERLFEHVEDTRAHRVLPGHEGRSVAALDSRHPIGPTKTLAVGPGDVVDIRAWAYHEGASSSEGSLDRAALVAAIVQGLAGIAEAGAELQQHLSDVLSQAPALLVAENEEKNAPHAYLNYILLDDSLHVRDMGHRSVAGTEAFKGGELFFEPLVVKETGYLYIYTSFEEKSSKERVFFDDLEIRHSDGPVVQSDDYYPFGMTFNSYRRAKSTGNRFLYNGKELQEETGWYDYGARNYDPTIARFIQVDPMAEILQEAWTPYHYVKNNPIKYIDPTGMIWKDQKEADELKNKVQDRIKNLGNQKSKLQAKLGEEGISDKKKARLENRINDIDSRTESLNGTVAAIDEIGAHEKTFDLVSNSGETNHVKEGSDGVINIQGGNDALHVHEIEHVSLSINSEKGLEFTSGGYLKPTTSSGLKDEVAGYRAQYGYDPSSLPGSPGSSRGIDLGYITNLKKSDGTPVYPALHQRWQNQQKQNRINKKLQKQWQNDGN